MQTAIPITAQPGGTREAMTVKDLRKGGSETIKQADHLTTLGTTLAGGGLVAEAVNTGNLPDLSALRGVSDWVQEAKGLIQPVLGVIGDNKWLALVIIGAGVFMIARKIKLRRLDDARAWRHVG